MLRKWITRMRAALLSWVRNNVKGCVPGTSCREGRHALSTRCILIFRRYQSLRGSVLGI